MADIYKSAVFTSGDKLPDRTPDALRAEIEHYLRESEGNAAIVVKQGDETKVIIGRMEAEGSNKFTATGTYGIRTLEDGQKHPAYVENKFDIALDEKRKPVDDKSVAAVFAPKQGSGVLGALASAFQGAAGDTASAYAAPYAAAADSAMQQFAESNPEVAARARDAMRSVLPSSDAMSTIFVKKDGESAKGEPAKEDTKTEAKKEDKPEEKKTEGKKEEKSEADKKADDKKADEKPKDETPKGLLVIGSESDLPSYLTKEMHDKLKAHINAAEGNAVVIMSDKGDRAVTGRIVSTEGKNFIAEELHERTFIDGKNGVSSTSLKDVKEKDKGVSFAMDEKGAIKNTERFNNLTTHEGRKKIKEEPKEVAAGEEEQPQKSKSNGPLGDNMFGLLGGVGTLLGMLMFGFDPLIAILGAVVAAFAFNFMDNKDHSFVNSMFGGESKSPEKSAGKDRQKEVEGTGQKNEQGAETGKSAPAVEKTNFEKFLKDDGRIDKADFAEMRKKAGNRDTDLGNVEGYLDGKARSNRLGGREVLLTPEAKEGELGALIYAKQDDKGKLYDVQVALDKDKLVRIEGDFDKDNTKGILEAARSGAAVDKSTTKLDEINDFVRPLFTPTTQAAAPNQQPGSGKGVGGN